VSDPGPPRAEAHSAWSSFASALAERHVVVRETPTAAHLIDRPHLRASMHAGELVVPPPAPDTPRAMMRLVLMRQVLGGAMPATPAARSPLWRRVFRTLELRRVDDAIARSYPGARPDLLALRTQTLTRRPLSATPGVLAALLRWALGAPPSHPLIEGAQHAPLDTPLDGAARAGELCHRHARSLTPPRGWSIEDRRPPAKAAPPQPVANGDRDGDRARFESEAELRTLLDAHSPLLARAFRSSGTL